MAHTNSTPNYALPQFLTTDKPAWLTDINSAFSSIDTGLNNAKTAADNAQSDATTAISNAATASSTASNADAKGSGAVASIAESFEVTNTYNQGDYVMYNNLLYVCTTAVTVPGPWTGSTNWSRTNVDAISDITNARITALNGTNIINNPTADPSKSIAQKIVDLENGSDPIINTPVGTVIATNASVVTGKLCCLAMRISTTAVAGAWNTIGTVNALPVDEVRTGFILTSDGTHGGMIRVTTAGNIDVFPINALNGNFAFNIFYKIQ